MSADDFEIFLNKIYLNTSKLELEDLTKLNKIFMACGGKKKGGKKRK